VLRVTIKELLAHKVRLILTSIAIVLGVAFMSGTFVLTDTIAHVFDNVFSQNAQGIDAVVRAERTLDDEDFGFSSRNPVPDEVLTVVQGTPGVALAEGTVSGFATVIDTNGDAVSRGQAPSVGISWNSGRFAESRAVTSGHRPRASNEVALDVDTANESGHKLGDPVTILFGQGEPEVFELSGIFDDNGGRAGATFAAFVPETAQRVLGQPGEWDSVNVAKQTDVSEQRLLADIRGALRADGFATGYEVKTGQQVADERASNVKDRLGFFNTFLLVFALIALFVGSFIIYNTFSIIVAQRGRELALLRALGASGSQVTRSVAMEAFFVGLFSSVVGLALGVLVALGLQELISAIGFTLPTESPQILPRTIIVALVAGTLVTFFAALAPARRAARIAPVEAMRASVVQTGGSNRRYRIGALLTLIGIVLLGVGLFGDVSSGSVPGGAAGVVGFASLLVFIGVAMLSPLVARPVSRMLGWIPARARGMSGVLARENAMRNPRRTATTASALMIGLALVTLVAIIGASVKQSFTNIIDDSVRADFLIQSSGGFNNRGFTPEVAATLRRELPGASVVQFRDGDVQIGESLEEIQAVGPNVEDALDIKLRPNARIDDFARGGVLVFKDTADDNGWKLGDQVDMQFEKTGSQSMTIHGIYNENQSIGSSYLLSLASYEEHFIDQRDELVAVRNASDTSATALRRVVDRVLEPFPTLEAQDQTEFKDEQIAQFDTILSLLYVLLLLAVFIALIGIVNTLALSVFERIRELGLLRAVGMSRRQVRTMVRDEAVIISIFGSLLGLVIGLLFGRALIAAINEESVTFVLPYSQLVIFVILAGIAGFLAGAWPAWRAAKHEVLEAIATE